ncbi:MAG: MotA/TolQ/ExbB proton channel family protein [Bacteroidales bacterium]|nr:MotA/TolQ/ExbB proton channel family protein [Bacteroidales bacterium]MBQ3595666.1 MotA/TolQ/ExbB proton channel family protein [Bacteroidales bacterium]
MKKLIALLTIAGFMTFGISNSVLAQQDETPAQTEQVATEEVAAEEAAPVEEVVTTTMTEEAEEEPTFHEVLKKQYIDGGWGFMTLVLVVLVLGLAISIERIIYLTLSTTNTKKLVADLEAALKQGGIEKAKELCRNTRGPVASIFYQGLMRYNDGLDEVEKAMISYGSVMNGNLSSGSSWITLCIALGPNLGFFGTVIGMVQAFDDIAAAGDISPTIVASGMKVALLTTVFGLITAMILQVAYNFILNKIEGILNDMEDSTISFMDILNDYSKKN